MSDQLLCNVLQKKESQQEGGNQNGPIILEYHLGDCFRVGVLKRTLQFWVESPKGERQKSEADYGVIGSDERGSAIALIKK